MGWSYLFLEVAGPTVLIYGFQRNVLFETYHCTTYPVAVRHESDGAVPWSGVSRFAVEQTHGHLVLAC